jgi:hypothetical protein
MRVAIKARSLQAVVSLGVAIKLTAIVRQPITRTRWLCAPSRGAPATPVGDTHTHPQAVRCGADICTPVERASHRKQQLHTPDSHVCRTTPSHVAVQLQVFDNWSIVDL